MNNLIIAQVLHKECQSSWFCAINKTQMEMYVGIDMRDTQFAYFTNTNGKSYKSVPPRSLKFLSSLTIDPRYVRVWIQYKFFILDEFDPYNDEFNENQAHELECDDK